MKSHPNQPSDLRQNIDMLSAQFDPATGNRVDPMLVMKLCQNIAMMAADNKAPLPGDVFHAGINDQLMRVSLSGMANGVMQLLNEQMKHAEAAVRAALKSSKLNGHATDQE